MGNSSSILFPAARQARQPCQAGLTASPAGPANRGGPPGRPPGGGRGGPPRMMCPAAPACTFGYLRPALELRGTILLLGLVWNGELDDLIAEG